MLLLLKPVSIKRRDGTYSVRRVPDSPLNSRIHWGERYRWTKAWKEEVGWTLKAARVNKPAFSKVVITLFTLRPMDEDNAVASVKPVIDGMKGIAIEDDDPQHLSLSVQTRKVEHRAEEHVQIELS